MSYEITNFDGKITESISMHVYELIYDSEGRYIRANKVDPEIIAPIIKAGIVSYLQSVFPIQTDDLALARANGYTWVDKGSEIDPPPDIRTEVNVKEGIKFKDFEKRSAAGEILMSNYTRANIEVIRSPGLKTVGNEHTNRGTVSTLHLESVGVLTRHPNPKSAYKWLINGYTVLLNRGTDFTVGSYQRTGLKGSSLWSYDSDLTAEDVYHAALDYVPEEITSLVTSVTADANRRSVDVLTAFAELPKTIGSVLRGFKTVATIAIDVKHKKFTLSKVYALRKKRVTQQYLQRIARLKAELSSNTISKSRRKALQKHLREVEETHAKALLKIAQGLADALSDLWLNFRYNIMSNVYLAQDVYDALYQYGKQFVTAAGTVRNNDSLLVKGYYIGATNSLRVLIKRRFSQSSANAGNSAMGNDLFVTAWELVPLSFVIDWFVNVGNLLTAQTYNTSWDSSGSTLATKQSWDVDLGSSSDDWVIKPRLIVRGSCYKRRVITPSDYCGLVWKPSMGLARQVDALALIWRPVRSLLLKSK